MANTFQKQISVPQSFWCSKGDGNLYKGLRQMSIWTHTIVGFDQHLLGSMRTFAWSPCAALHLSTCFREDAGLFFCHLATSFLCDCRSLFLSNNCSFPCHCHFRCLCPFNFVRLPIANVSLFSTVVSDSIIATLFFQPHSCWRHWRAEEHKQ